MQPAPPASAPGPAPLSRVERVLVIVLRQLGDVLLATPAIRAIKQRFPAAEIIACVNAGTEAMLAGNPDLSRVLAVRRAASGLDLRGKWQEAWLAVEARRLRCDLALDLTANLRSSFLAIASGAPHRWSYDTHKGFPGRRRCFTGLVPPRPNEHVIRKHLRLLAALGIDAPNPRLVFEVTDADRAAVAALLPVDRPILQVHPVSRIAKKNWPASFLAELLPSLSQRGFLPVLTGSSDPVERQWIDALCASLRIEHLNLSGRLSLKQLGALSERAACFLGVDTAPMHIAAALNRPVMAFFGPTSETLWAPWCDRHLILSRDLPCRLPCKNNKGCQTIECLREFTPAMVAPRIHAFLDSLAPQPTPA